MVRVSVLWGVIFDFRFSIFEGVVGGVGNFEGWAGGCVEFRWIRVGLGEKVG